VSRRKRIQRPQRPLDPSRAMLQAELHEIVSQAARCGVPFDRCWRHDPPFDRWSGKRERHQSQRDEPAGERGGAHDPMDPERGSLIGTGAPFGSRYGQARELLADLLTRRAGGRLLEDLMLARGNARWLRHRLRRLQAEVRPAALTSRRAAFSCNLPRCLVHVVLLQLGMAS
jgi:hypothetical protein